VPSQPVLVIRPWVSAFAAISFALKAGLYLLLLLPLALPMATPRPWLLVALLAGIVASTAVRSILVRRLSTSELAVVQFWSLTPLLILFIAGGVGALPVLVLDQLADALHWSETILRTLIAFALTAALISAAVMIWMYWMQLRTSLLPGPAEPEALPEPHESNIIER
jgi:hypothetical protein